MTRMLMDNPNPEFTLLTTEQGKIYSLILLSQNGKRIEFDESDEAQLNFTVRWCDHSIHPEDFLKIARWSNAKVTCTTLAYVEHQYKECNPFTSLSDDALFNRAEFVDVLLEKIYEPILYNRYFNDLNHAVEFKDDTIQVVVNKKVITSAKSLKDLQKDLLNNEGLLLFTTNVEILGNKVIEIGNSKHLISIKPAKGHKLKVNIVSMIESTQDNYGIFKSGEKILTNEELYNAMAGYLTSNKTELDDIFDIVTYLYDLENFQGYILHSNLTRKYAESIFVGLNPHYSSVSCINPPKLYAVYDNAHNCFINWDEKGIRKAYSLTDAMLTEDLAYAERIIKEANSPLWLNEYRLFEVDLKSTLHSMLPSEMELISDMEHGIFHPSN